MKKKNLKSLKLNKKSISNINGTLGGAVSSDCPCTMTCVHYSCSCPSVVPCELERAL